MEFKERLEILFHDNARFMDEKLVDAKIENGHIVFKTHPDKKRKCSGYNEKKRCYYWKIVEIKNINEHSIFEIKKYWNLIIKERIRKLK